MREALEIHLSDRDYLRFEDIVQDPDLIEEFGWGPDCDQFYVKIALILLKLSVI